MDMPGLTSQLKAISPPTPVRTNRSGTVSRSVNRRSCNEFRLPEKHRLHEGKIEQPVQLLVDFIGAGPVARELPIQLFREQVRQPSGGLEGPASAEEISVVELPLELHALIRLHAESRPHRPALGGGDLDDKIDQRVIRPLGRDVGVAERRQVEQPALALDDPRFLEPVSTLELEQRTDDIIADILRAQDPDLADPYSRSGIDSKRDIGLSGVPGNEVVAQNGGIHIAGATQLIGDRGFALLQSNQIEPVPFCDRQE